MRRFIMLAVMAFFAWSAVASGRRRQAQRHQSVDVRPYMSNLVRSDWINNTGCPTNATISTYDSGGNVVQSTYGAAVPGTGHDRPEHPGVSSS